VLDINSKGTRGHSCKPIKARCTRDIAIGIFSNKVINRWNALEQSAVDVPAFKNSLEKARNNPIGLYGLLR